MKKMSVTMAWLSMFLGKGSGKKSMNSRKRNDSEAQLRGFILDIRTYINKRLYNPDSELVQLQFLDRSTRENAATSTAIVQQFFQRTKEQLQSYKSVISAIAVLEQDRFSQNAKIKTVEVLEGMMGHCQFFYDRAESYRIYQQDGTVKRLLNHTIKNYLATLEMFSEVN